MDLPDWIDKPVPNAAMDEHHDAVGKLVVAAQDVEAWLAFFAHRLGACASYAEAARFRATQLVVKIRQSVEHVPVGDRDDLRSALRRTSAILTFRNAVVHAMPRSFEDGSRRRESELHPPPRDQFTTEMLIGAALAAQSVADYFSLRATIWPQFPTDTLRGASNR